MMPTNANRKYWLETLAKIAHPVLSAMAEKRLKIVMPVESKIERTDCTYLEALGRTLCGIAPWLELDLTEGEEGLLRQQYAELARKAVDAATDPSSPDRCNFADGRQPLVDAAFLAHAIVRAPRELWEKLDDRVKRNTANALKETRRIRPGFNNWILFAALVETALLVTGEEYDTVRLDYALRQHEQWYKGDGMYGDGPDFHWDYYNSFVIQPMLVDTIQRAARIYDGYSDGERMYESILKRARRYAAVQERLIAPDGSFPAIGRSITYRSGAFQSLAQSALRKDLPEDVSPAQVRCALQAIIKRCLEAPGTFDEQGWLRIGLSGHQPGLGETYISTGSLYLCCAVFLPLGLPPQDDFWSAPDEKWTAQKIWSGEEMPADHAISG